MANWDVAVVGGGGAGMAAAIEAADHGARVLLLEAAETPGGSTQLSGGVYYAAGTDVQRAAGIDDSVDAFFEYYMTLSQWLVDADVVRRLCDRAEPGLRWLRDLPADDVTAWCGAMLEKDRVEFICDESLRALQG